MSGVSRVAVAVLCAAIATQPACAGVSENNRRGILVVGGATVVVGSLITLDGMTCDETATGSLMSCEEDSDELEHGLVVLGVGAILIGLGVYLYLTAPAREP
jgi:hypothetical protein